MLTAYYDLERNPPTFNFFDFLLRAEMRRMELCEDRLQVRIIPGPMQGFRNDRLPPFGGEERTRWMNNICIPMPMLLPSCGEPAQMDDGSKPEGPTMGKGQYLVGFRSNTDAAKANLYPFRGIAERTADYKRRHGDGYVTVTLRETGWWKSRQSDLNVWTAAARYIKDMGYRVVFLRDAMKAHEPVDGFPTEPEASLNVAERASLYAGASMNLGIANGPLWFAWFMRAPVAIFNLVHDDEPCASKSSYENSGLQFGAQLPNAGKRQRLVWGKDTPESIVDTFCELTEAAHVV
jgi:hypothetical protein